MKIFVLTLLALATLCSCTQELFVARIESMSSANALHKVSPHHLAPNHVLLWLPSQADVHAAAAVQLANQGIRLLEISPLDTSRRLAPLLRIVLAGDTAATVPSPTSRHHATTSPELAAVTHSLQSGTGLHRLLVERVCHHPETNNDNADKHAATLGQRVTKQCSTAAVKVQVQHLNYAVNSVSTSRLLVRWSAVDAAGAPSSVNSELAALRCVLEALLSDERVLFVEPAPAVTAQPANEFAKPVVLSGSVINADSSALSTTLDGTGELLGVGDTGIDYDNCFFLDQSVAFPINPSPSAALSQHRKIAAYLFTVGSGDASDASGHGTGVVGSALGTAMFLFNSSLEDQLTPFNGLASGARVVFMDLSAGNTEAITPPVSLGTDYLQRFYDFGARVGLTAWQSDSQNFYGSGMRDVDTFVYQNPDFLPVFAAGNSASAGFRTVSAAAQAKNALTVGASMTGELAFDNAIPRAQYQDVFLQFQDELCISGTDSPLWGDTEFCQSTFGSPAPCLSERDIFCTNFQTVSGCCSFTTFSSLCCAQTDSDRIVAYPGYYGVSTVASFSSRGPSFDGRIKPDVLAPGFPIVSASSDGDVLSLQCGAPGTVNSAVTSLPTSGTSNSAAFAAAAALIVRQYFRDGYFPTGSPVSSDSLSPSAALIKSLIINGAMSVASLSGVNAALNPGVYFPVAAAPNFYQGFGRLTMNASLAFPTSSFNWMLLDGDRLPVSLYPTNVFADGNATLTTNQTVRFCFRVNSNSSELRATLVWTDPPAAAAADITLVNDLDLLLMSPSGVLYYPNFGDGPDSTNNVERVLVALPEVGIWSVYLFGSYVPMGPQPFALTVTGQLVESTCLAPASAQCPSACSQQGSCNTTTGMCSCGGLRRGPACTQQQCRNDCSAHGVCTGSGGCSCLPGWIGVDCSVADETNPAAQCTTVLKKRDNGIPVGAFVGTVIGAFIFGAILAIFIGLVCGLWIGEVRRKAKKKQALARLGAGGGSASDSNGDF